MITGIVFALFMEIRVCMENIHSIVYMEEEQKFEICVKDLEERSKKETHEF